MSRLPPLRSLVAFEAAVRHESFTGAAEELHVTPGAVGQLVRKLEDWLGVSLFLREIRQLTVTAEGRAYHERIGPALIAIANASQDLRRDSAENVRISMPPAFAARWFSPRLHDFIARHPDIRLDLRAGSALADFSQDEVDLAIRYFDGRDASLEVHLICADQARLFCSPAYRDALALSVPDDLRRATLLHNTLHPHWSAWCQRFTIIPEAAVDAITGIRFDQSLLAIDAATRHQGLVLTSRILVDDELAHGTLVEPFDLGLPLDKGYYLVSPREPRDRPAVHSLKRWLIEQAG